MRLRNHLLLLSTVSTLTLAACGDSNTIEPDPTPVPTTIEVEGPDSLMVGASVTLEVTVTDQDDQVMTDVAVEWTSSDASVLRVTGAGAAEALADGTARVTATAGDLSTGLDIRAYSAPAVVLAEDTIIMTGRGDSVAVSASVSGESVPVQLSALSETRWNDDLGVAHLAGDTVVAVSAGAALYLVHADGHPFSSPDTLLVRIEPEVPYLARMEANGPVGPDSPMLLHGYGLNGLPAGAITADGQTAAVTPVDSATVSIAFDAIPQEVCAGARATLEVEGADVLPESRTFQRERIGAISLEAGEARRLSPAEADCIKVNGPDSARFALAHYDARYAYSREETLPYQKSESFSITLADVSGGAAASGSLLQAARLQSPPQRPQSLAGPHARLEAAADSVRPGDEWMVQTTPYRLGDTLTVGSYTVCGDPDSHDIQVISVIDDYLTVSVPVDSLASIPAGSLDPLLEKVSAFDDTHLDWIQGLFGARPALTNGQYMILVCPTTNQTRGGAAEGHMAVYADYLPPLPSQGLYQVLAHEYAHSAAMAHEAQDSARVGTVPGKEMWWNEGLADMVGLRAAAEYVGQSFTANVQHSEARDTPPLEFLAQAMGGEIENGYTGAAAFGFDLTWRVAEASALSWQEAHDTVTLAMAHNRYGCSASGCDSFDGLYDVMQRHLGPDWDPVDAVLTYVASYAADDRIESDIYRQPSVYRVSDLITGGEPHGGLLGPKIEIAAYSGDTVAVAPTGNVGATSLVAGSAGWNRLIGGGGAFRATSDAPDIEWLLIRIE